MLTYPQREKLRKSLNKLTPYEIIRIQRRIRDNCIQFAASSKTRQRLVNVAIEARTEEMKRIHVRGYEYPRGKSKGIWQTIKESFKS